MKGKVIDKNIKLDKLIGKEAFGEIYFGNNVNSGKEWAVKAEKSDRKSGLLELKYPNKSPKETSDAAVNVLTLSR